MPNWSSVTYICSSPSFSVRDFSLGTHLKETLFLYLGEYYRDVFGLMLKKMNV